MELILWRHAEAEPAEPGQADAARVLTAKGHKQAAKVGAWLDRHLPNGCKILTSPAVRTVQTAEALGRKFKVHPGLAPAANAAAVLTIANWPDAREPVLIVGHQPTLGEVASLLIAGTELDWSIRKAGVWWIVQKDRDDDGTISLKLVMSPELASK